jgi:ABC-type nitrate/sulfonate/bicarbonate transport system, ATPase component
MALAIKNLCKSYPGIQIFDGLDMDVQENKITCILGPSGIGKTTLLNIISGITPPDSGNISDFEGKDFSYIFQEPRLLYWKTVYENISFVLKDTYKEKELQSRVNRYLEIVGLFKYRDYYPNKLSGGMEQRVSIARAFAYPSEILLMDEPFKSLDAKLKKNLLNSFLALWETDTRTVLFVTHDIEEAAYISNFVYVLEDSFPTKIKNMIQIEKSFKERLADYQAVREIKKTLIEFF